MRKKLLTTMTLICGLIFTIFVASCKKKQECKNKYRTIKFNQNVKPLQPGSVFIYQISHDSDKMLVLGALFIIGKDQINDFIRWASNKQLNKTLVKFRDKFSSPTDKELYVIANSLHLGIKHYRNNPIGNAFIADIDDNYIQLYSIDNENGFPHIAELDEVSKTSFSEQYSKKLASLNDRLFPKILNNKGKTRKFAKATAFYYIYYDVFELESIDCDNTSRRVYAENMGCVGVIYPPKFEKIFSRYPKQAYFPKCRTLLSLVAFLPSAETEGDIYYNDRILNFRDKKFYFNSFPNGVPIPQPDPGTRTTNLQPP